MPDARLESLANGAHRHPRNLARNAARHPVETLEFFGLTADMTVLEILPAVGWYTEILAPIWPRRVASIWRTSRPTASCRTCRRCSRCSRNA